MSLAARETSYEKKLAEERELQQAKKAAREAAKPNVKVDVRERGYFPLVPLLGVLVIAGLAFLTLWNFIELTNISSEVVELKSEYEQLKTKNNTLKAKYDEIFNLKSVKDAAEAAGMTEPSSSQIDYIDISNEDNAVIYREETQSFVSQIFTFICDGFYQVKEYFD